MSTYRRLSFFLLTTMVLLTSACGGGSSSGGDSSGNESRPEFTVSVETGDGGKASPDEQQVKEGEQASIDLIPDSGFRLQSASGCDGTLQGTQYITGPLVADCQVSAVFIPQGSLSGQLLPAPDTGVDQTLNDKQAPLGGNSQCSDAQAIDNRVTLHGFASASATGGDPEQEHYAETGNSRDFYRVALNPGQVIELEVADNGGDNDLELHLWNSECSRKIDASTEGGDVEQVASTLGGESVVEVRAQAGIAKYVLRVTTAWESEYDASELEAFSERMPAFSANEAILTFSSDAGARPHDALNEALNRALGLQLHFSHEQPGRATLARIEPSANFAPLAAPLSGTMEDLKQLGDPRAYEVINTLRIIDFLARQPRVRFAEPNYLLNAQRVPNDPEYSDQWHYEQIQLPRAWDSTVGERDDGKDVIVAVVDSGVYLEHEDLQAKLVPGWDFHADDDDPDDLNSDNVSSWHGTHVAGTVAGSTDNGRGVAGVSWAASIMPLRVLGDEGGSRYDVMQGVRYAAGLSNDSGRLPERPAGVINLSLGGGGYSGSEQNLYNEVRSAGAIVVAAAGNENSDQPMYPAAYDGVLSVSASNCHNERASYSNYGSTISLAAPGGDSGGCTLLNNSGAVHSTLGSGSGASRSSSYGSLMGTSMASPHVAGVVALMRAVYPDLKPNHFDKLLLDGQLTDDLGPEGRDDEFGYGLANATKAVQAAQNLAQGDEWPAGVVADPTALYLGQTSEDTVELRQEGEGQAPAVLSGDAEADWLSVAEANVDGQGLGTYQVSVNREAFGDGDSGEYRSDLVFSLEDNSELRVPVHIQVGFASEAAPIYVTLLDPETREPIYESAAQWNSAGELRYHIEGVAAGDYIVVAGSDIDADKFICQPGEICGAYPAFDDREAVSVAEGAVEGIDVAIDILSRFRAFTGGSNAEGIPRQ